MSQQVVTNPADVAKNKLDGWNSYIWGVGGPLLSAVVGYITDPAHQTEITQVIAYAGTALPSVIGFAGMIRQTILDSLKVNAAGKVATAQATPIPTVTATIPNPDYGKFQPAQIEAFNKPIALPQLKPDVPNIVTKALDGMTDYVKTEANAIQLLLDNIAAAIDQEFQRYVTASMQPLEALQKVVKQYLDINLTPQDCEAIMANKNLASILHSYADKTIIGSIWTARQAKTLGEGVWQGIMNQAYRYARQNVINAFAKQVLEADTEALRNAALGNFGLNEYTQKTAVFSGGSGYINIRGGFRPFNAYDLLQVDSASLKPLE